MKNIKLFLVEDEYIIREGIRDGVDWEANGIEFTGDAPDGEIALGKILEIKPDIVITDIRMPFMDGLELSRHIKKDLPDTKIIVLTGHEEFSYAKECISIGVNDYLLKPISREELLKKINLLADEIREESVRYTELSGSGLDADAREKIMDYLRFGDEEKIDDFMKWFLENIGETDLKSRVYRQYITMDLYLSAKGYLEDLDADEQVKEEIKKSFAEDDVPNSYEETVGYIKDIFLKTVRMRKQIRSSKGSEVVEKVLYYVSKNYEDEELSLNQVAEYAGFSANHLSTVFHQEYGEPFVKYLTSYRMEKAKKLLKETDLKTSDICYKVGYKDPHYFSSIFKKTQGVTPTRYREDYGI